MESSSKRQLFYSCGILISWRVHRKESCFKVSECIYHPVFITRKVVLKLRNIYIIQCSSQGKLFESCGMHISLSVHHKRSCFNVAECIYHGVFIERKVVLKLRNVYMIQCSSQGKLFYSCGMYISWRVHRKESCFKVEECIYHPVFIPRKFISKLRNVYFIQCSSKGMLF